MSPWIASFKDKYIRISNGLGNISGGKPGATV
jgi:hypothetical protein